jgi:hypothetical protein
VNCVKRGWPSRLWKGEEHELESKPLFVLFFPLHAASIRCCYHHFFLSTTPWKGIVYFFLVAIAQLHKEEDDALGIIIFFFLQCNSMKRIIKTCWVCRDFFCCYSTTLRRGQWQHLVGDCFFFLLLCNFAKRTMMTTTCWVHRCFFLPCNATPWRGDDTHLLHLRRGWGQCGWHVIFLF